MTYSVELAVACGAKLDTGRRIFMKVDADSRLDAAIEAERRADEMLSRPDIEFTHARSVALVLRRPPAVTALAIAA